MTAYPGVFPQVFDEFSATIGVPFEYSIESGVPHMDLTKPDQDGSHGVSTACSVGWDCKCYFLDFDLKPDKNL